jgi:hypothetical protein
MENQTRAECLIEIEKEELAKLEKELSEVQAKVYQQMGKIHAMREALWKERESK